MSAILRPRISDSVAAAMHRLQVAADTRTPCAPVRDLIGTSDIATAYEVQQQLAARRISAGATVVGRKIGLTALSVQQQLGVDQPDFGVLFTDREVVDGGTLEATCLLQGKVEAEVALVLARDIDNPAAGPDDIVAACDCAVASLEIVDSRIAGWRIAFADTVADNASSGYYVLGTQRKPLAGLICIVAAWSWKSTARLFRSAPVQRASAIRCWRRHGWRAHWQPAARFCARGT